MEKHLSSSFSDGEYGAIFAARLRQRRLLGQFEPGIRVSFVGRMVVVVVVVGGHFRRYQGAPNFEIGYAEQDRQKDDAVDDADQDDQEYSFEERLDHVRIDVGQYEYAEYGRQTTLDDWPGETAECEANPIQRGVVLADRVRVGDVGGKVDRKADRHDQRDHRHAIHGQIPQCHVADDADVDRGDHQRHPN
ncbi:hypothetical protein T07_2643 [Trichinella nelsoni]|uniref:Uncharacterized protein n=1 Tax=Trichinella nelsoni TaxID=6336 RepID=A0A0V0S2F7_9BILA|nr:hypothetical protein T07_2643 [Trichinella nelsoni]